MNNLDKKIELVNAITTLSIKISTKTPIDIFIDYSAHVNGLNVKILKNGWNAEKYNPDFNKTIYLDWENAGKELQEVLDYLGGIKDEHNWKDEGI